MDIRSKSKRHGFFARPESSWIRLLGQEQSIITFNGEVADRAFVLGMAQSQLTGAEVVYQPNFCPPEAVCPIDCGIDADQGNPVIAEAAVLPRRHMIPRPTAAREEPIASSRRSPPEPGCQRLSASIR